MDSLPTAEQNPEGFHQRYNVTKCSGEPIDPDAEYLVLRIDRNGDDPVWINACRTAAGSLAYGLLQRTDAAHLHTFARELNQRLIDGLRDQPPSTD